jgi:hypothetical protein
MLSSGLRFPLVEISPLVCRTTFTVRGKAGRLSAGTTLTVISNTAATPIVGTFANLPDHSIVTIGGITSR